MLQHKESKKRHPLTKDYGTLEQNFTNWTYDNGISAVEWISSERPARRCWIKVMIIEYILLLIWRNCPRRRIVSLSVVEWIKSLFLWKQEFNKSNLFTLFHTLSTTDPTKEPSAFAFVGSGERKGFTFILLTAHNHHHLEKMKRRRCRPIHLCRRALLLFLHFTSVFCCPKISNLVWAQ